MVTEAFLCRHTSNYRIATMDNTSLLSNNWTISTCFCQECRIKRKDHFAEMSLCRMYTCINALSGVREIRSERLFENTLNQIANGKAYHDACLRGSGLKKWKSWAKKQDQFKMLPNTMLTRISTFVNDCRVCYDRWDDIVRNLSDPRFSNIEVSTLSVHYLRESASRTWCERYNDAVRRRRGQQGDPLYTSERYQQILQMVVNSGIIGELQHNPGYVASFFGRIQHDAIAIARRVNPN